MGAMAIKIIILKTEEEKAKETVTEETAKWKILKKTVLMTLKTSQTISTPSQMSGLLMHPKWKINSFFNLAAFLPKRIFCSMCTLTYCVLSTYVLQANSDYHHGLGLYSSLLAISLSNFLGFKDLFSFDSIGLGKPINFER